MSPNTKRSAPSKNEELAANNKKTADAWWSGELGSTHNIDKQETRLTALPNNIGWMKLFKDPITLKMSDAELMSGVNENSKLCISLTDTQYDFLNSIQEAMNNKLVSQIKGLDNNYMESEFMSSIKVSDATEKKYLKTKVQLLGATRSMGVDVDGGHVTNPILALSTPGTRLDIRIRIDGVYVTKGNAGMMTKVDLFRIKSVPDEEELEAEREAKRARYEQQREEALENF